MNVFIRAIVRIFSFGERFFVVPFNEAIADLSPHENILTIALINIHYLVAGVPVPSNYRFRVKFSSISFSKK